MSKERGYKISYEPKMTQLPTKAGMTDYRYLLIYPLQKTVDILAETKNMKLNSASWICLSFLF